MNFFDWMSLVHMVLAKHHNYWHNSLLRTLNVVQQTFNIIKTTQFQQNALISYITLQYILNTVNDKKCF